MSWKKIGLFVVFADFLALNAYVVYSIGYVGFFEAVLGNIAGVAVFTDLVIALSLVLVWLVRDARERGLSAFPYIAVTLVLGSVGPLLYLLRRPDEEGAPLPSAALSARA